MTVQWQEQRADAVAQRILDVAEDLYAAHGVDAVTMRALAAKAGCSRATLYRYFASREAVQAAFVDRSAARIARAVARGVTATEPAEQLVSGIRCALALVRDNPAFANWFRADGVATAAQLAVVSPVVESLARGFVAELGESATTSADERARWLVRVMLSLLSSPGSSPDEESRMLHSFVVPVIVG
ncbi:TetR/AcrR family transcriptional regulator [Gordonia crocea]|uniref:Putative HTH-type transcriptional regulator n=1 Tax=Gordonia crocea TaxID=589162 RepID=A0A7I9V1J9_9ACTN|nr:TetR/AcrR family transcriptional regulator [Gordonia crocea]GED99021.1 putative HTH-type transcriptional regulator [Gordonia crocea]